MAVNDGSGTGCSVNDNPGSVRRNSAGQGRLSQFGRWGTSASTQMMAIGTSGREPTTSEEPLRVQDSGPKSHDRYGL